MARRRFAGRRSVGGGAGFIFPPFSLALDNDSMDTGAAEGTLVGNLVVSPADAHLTLLDSDGAKFALVDGSIEAGAVTTGDGDGSYQNITVRSLWGGRTTDFVLRINLNNITLPGGESFTSGDAEGTKISDINSTWTGATFSIVSQTLANGVKIVGTELQVGPGGAALLSTDAELDTVVIRATKDGVHFDKSFDIQATAA